MQVFGRSGSTRGCFVKWDIDAGQSKGARLAIYGSTGDAIVLPSSAEKYLPIVITGISINLRDSVSRLKCFRSRVYTYAFGADIGSASVSFTTFLNKGQLKETKTPNGQVVGVQGSSDVIATMLRLYNIGRISNSKRMAKISIGTDGKVVSGQIDALSATTQSVDYNLQSFQLNMTTIPAPLPNKKA